MPVRTRQQAQGGVTYATPHVTKPRVDLITLLASPRSGILDQSVRSCLISPTEVDPCHPLKENDLATANPLSASITSLSHSLLPIKTLHFVQLLRAPFCLLDGMLPNS